MHWITRSCVLFLWIHTLTFVESKECTLQQFLSSKLYDSNFDTTTLEERYIGGTQIRVGCVVGYTGFFKLLCVEGEWQPRGTKCQPRSCGHPGDAQFADFQLVLGEDFVFGSQVSYTCHKGYQMVSRKNYRTCMAEGWDGVVPVCEAQSCKALHVEDNVLVNGDTQEANYGNVVRFSCKSNAEVLIGSAEMYCDENGEWTGDLPRCEAVKCAVPIIENGYVPGGSQAQRVYDEHEILHFACDIKYKRTEDRPSRCTKVGGKPEFIPTPACELIKCKLDQLTPEGTTYDPAFRNVFLPDEKLRIRCGDKYYFSHHRETSAEITCKDDGKWTAIITACREVICDRYDRLVSYWSYSREPIKLDQTSPYTCKRGYKSTGGATEAKCTRDGWTPDPLCEEIICLSKDIENAVIVNNRGEYKYDQRITYRCKEGYKGSPSRTCKEYGWTATSGCAEITCVSEDINNADIINFQQEYKFNQKAHYRCKKGFKGSPFRTCKERGWNGQTACTAVTCARRRFDHAETKERHSTYRYNEKIQYTCKNQEGGFTLTCGEKGWIGSTACSTCETAEVKNGYVVVSSADTVYYTCNEGFKLPGKGWWGQAKCENHEWVGLQQCIGQRQCGQIPVILNGAVQPRNRVYNHNEAVEIRCNKGYQVNAERYLICKEGNWSSALPLETICTRIPSNCKAPPKVENAAVLTPHEEEYLSGFDVTYQCHDSYIIEREDRRRCENGKWEENDITCLRACLKPEDENHITYHGDRGHGERYRGGETIDYVCTATQGRGTATCENGEWIKSVKCEGVCLKPEDENHITYHGDRRHGEIYRRGETIDYVCTATQGRGTATCENGEWIKSVKCEGVCLKPEDENHITYHGDRRHGEIYRRGETIDYVCTATQGRGTATCENGEWINSVKCEGVCLKPEDENHRYHGLRGHGEIYRGGETIDYVCTATQGRGTATCENGEWIKSVKCEGVCLMPENENHITYYGIHGHGERYRGGETIDYVCTATDESGTATCENGEWIKSGKCEAPPHQLAEVTTDKQGPVDDTTDKQGPVDDTTDKQGQAAVIIEG